MVNICFCTYVIICSFRLHLLPSSAPAPTSTELEAELVIFSCLYSHPTTHPGEFKFDLIWCQYQNKSGFICQLGLKNTLRTQPLLPKALAELGLAQLKLVSINFRYELQVGIYRYEFLVIGFKHEFMYEVQVGVLEIGFKYGFFV